MVGQDAVALAKEGMLGVLIRVTLSFALPVRAVCS